MDLTCIGSVVADILVFGTDANVPAGTLALAKRIELHLGGCATNTSVAAVRLGVKSRLIGCVGRDDLGQWILKKLLDAGVVTNGISQTSTHSGTSVILVSGNGERTILYYPGSNALLGATEINVDTLTSSRIVHFADTFLLPLLDGEPTSELLKQLKEAGVATSVDVSWDPHARWGSLISSYFPFIDFLFCNRTEAEMLTGFADPNDAARFLLDQGVKCVIVKMGSAGSRIFRSSSVLEISAVSTEVLDTTGAGDSYAAGFLVGVLEGWDDYRIGCFASAAAAASIRSLGATSGIVSFADTLSLAKPI